MVILEEIRSQNRVTLKAVESVRLSVEIKIDGLGSEVRGDIRMLQGAIQGHSADLRQLKAETAALKEHLSRLDAVITADYRDRLHRLEERIEALERRSA